MDETKTIDPERTEYGYYRTKCGCRECTISCEHIPGYLVPADVPRIAKALGYDDLGKFAAENLWASSGATVQRRHKDGRIELFQVPTLVPQRQANGHCKFLKEGKCTIHAVAPFGCAFFDSHAEDWQERTHRGVTDIYQSHETGSSDYHLLWWFLASKKLLAPTPTESRVKLADAYKAETGKEIEP